MNGGRLSEMKAAIYSTSAEYADRGGAGHKARTKRSGSQASSLRAVLIVDAIADDALALASMLRRDDIEIVTAASDRDAREALLHHDVAVAIIDVTSPATAGFELAQLIRGADRTRHVPVIFVTAGSEAGHPVSTGYEIGAVDILFKPLHGPMLRAKVDALLTLDKQKRNLDLALAQAERTAARMAFLCEASAELSKSLDYELALRRVAALAVPRLAHWCAIDLSLRPEQEPSRMAFVHLDAADLVVPDAGDALGRIRELGKRWLLRVPITASGRSFGAITLVSAESASRYVEPDLEMAEDLGRRAGLAIENARLFEAERSARQAAQAAEQRRAAVQSLSDAALGQLETEALLDEMLARVRRIFTCDVVEILLLSADRQRLEIRACDGIERAAWEHLVIPYGAGIAGGIAERGESLVVDDLNEVEVYNPVFREYVRSVAGVPLVLRQEVLGVLLIGVALPRKFTPEDVELLATVAARVALALDRASAYEDLRRTEERLHLALAAGRMGVWEWTLATGRVTWSPTLEAIHGLATGTFPGTFEAYQSDMHAEDKDRVLRTIRETLEAGHDHYLEYRIVLPDGDIRWLSARGKVTQDRDGRPIGMLGVCMDVTEQKRLEQAREAAVAELQQTLHYNEIFAGILAHDLRNPLSAIITAVQWLLQLHKGADDALVDPFKRVLASGERMTRMIDQLLDFTRVRVGRGIEIAPRPAQLADLCEQVVDELAWAHPEWRVQVESRGDLVGVWDPDRMLQVVSNLIANAGQHGEAGANIVVRLDGSDADSVTLDIHNDGSISEELLPELFTPFRSPRAQRAGGLGLGLFITQQIIVAHGGSVAVSSSEANGTTFSIRLPRRARPRELASWADSE